MRPPREGDHGRTLRQIEGPDVVGRGWADGGQSSTCLRLSESCKAQREVLVASGKIDVHATITHTMLDVKPSRESNHGHTPLQFEALT